MSDLEPIPQSAAAVEEFGPFSHGEGDLLDELRASAARVRDLVPECIGISLASQEHGVTFTVVASDEVIAALDAVQYVNGGPCVTGVEAERVLQFSAEELRAEVDWQLFAEATAASSVASTLTLPVLVDGLVVGSVNLYAATREAFTGHHEQVADIFHAWAPGAVANADLSFSTRTLAEQAPHILHDQVVVNAAVGTLAAFGDLNTADARAQLEDVARRAGTTVTAVAERLLASASRGPAGDDD